MSLRDLEEMLAERGIRVDHVSLHRWVQRFAPELERRLRPHLRPAGRTWHVDETYVRAGGGWRYLYRAVDGAGRTVEFLLSATRDAAAAARRFFSRALGRGRARAPRLVATDRLASCRTVVGELARDGRLPASARHLRGRWLNNRVEQDHRRVERRTRPMLGSKGFATARRALAGIEAMAMLAEGQVRGVRTADGPAQRACLCPPDLRCRRLTASARGSHLIQPRSTQQNRSGAWRRCGATRVATVPCCCSSNPPTTRNWPRRCGGSPTARRSPRARPRQPPGAQRSGKAE